MEEDREILDHLYSASYDELRRLAAVIRRKDPSQTLSPTALANEAYLRLAGSLQLKPESHLHFKRIVARAMRRVLIESARRRMADKRGAGAAFVTFDESMNDAAVGPEQLLALDSALESLAEANPRQAMMVEYRFIGGFDIAETAELLGVSQSTIVRDWRAAKAWLSVEMRRAS